jgi:hypothetical protein
MLRVVVAVSTREKLRQFVRQMLCDRDKLDLEQTPFYEARITRSGRSCGLYFEIHGPRLVRSCAIWAGEEHRILFYDSMGERYAEVRLSEAPDPLKLKDEPPAACGFAEPAKPQAA